MSPQDDRLPMTVLLPDSTAGAIEAFDSAAALRLAVVGRDAVKGLGADWDKPGVYVRRTERSGRRRQRPDVSVQSRMPIGRRSLFVVSRPGLAERQRV